MKPLVCAICAKDCDLVWECFRCGSVAHASDAVMEARDRVIDATVLSSGELVELAARLVRVTGPDHWPSDAIEREPVVDVAMQMKVVGQRLMDAVRALRALETEVKP